MTDLAILSRALPAMRDQDFAVIARQIKDFGLTDLERDLTIDELLVSRNKTSAIEDVLSRCVRDRDLQLEAQNDIAELRLRQERRIGQMLGATEKHRGGRPSETCDIESQVSYSELGIHRKQASRWQAEAKVPEPVFEKYIADTRRSGGELSSKGVVKLAMQQPAPVVMTGAFDHCRVVHGLSELRGESFATVYADPPWRYGNQATRAATDNHYATMTVDELCEMPVSHIVSANAHLHIWTTNAFLFDAYRVIQAWGFEYKSCFVWVKPQMGIGNYWRVSHEFLLLGVRGAMPFRDKSLMSWDSIERGEHSAKPESVRLKIERASPGPYLELFGRRTAPGWTVMGNQVERNLFSQE